MKQKSTKGRKKLSPLEKKIEVRFFLENKIILANGGKEKYIEKCKSLAAKVKN